jgi:enoyl-CoA hydratase
MEVITTGGAPVAPELVRQVRERLNCSLQSAYGQTEASPMICLNHDNATLDDICFSAGQPLPHTSVSIRDPENGEVMPVGEVGEICASGYNIMLGYHDNEASTRVTIDADGWLHSGDLGKLDSRGFIYVTGRVKDMIIRGGENHFPAEIENLLIEHPDVAEVSVVGIPDEKWGEGGAFCAGWDLKQAAALDNEGFFEQHNMPTDTGNVPPALLGPSRLELDKPVIAAVAGPAVAGGMELALWCDFRVMEESAHFGVYCRRWGIPLIDGGTVRLPRLVGEGRAREIVLTGRKVTAAESLQIGLAEYVVADGECRVKAEAPAHEIAAHPQTCVRTDRRSLVHQHGKTVREAMTLEWHNGREALLSEGIEGAGRFGNPSEKN